jgi:hypothetical protein
LVERAAEEAVEVGEFAVEQLVEAEPQVDDAPAAVDGGIGVDRAHDGLGDLGALLPGHALAKLPVVVGNGGEALVDAVFEGGQDADGAGDLGEGAADVVQVLGVGEVVGDRVDFRVDGGELGLALQLLGDRDADVGHPGEPAHAPLGPRLDGGKAILGARAGVEHA